LAEGDLPTVFAIISWGCSATVWTAKLLTFHPEIYCVHHLRNRFARVSSLLKNASDVQLLRILQGMGVGYKLVGEIHGTACSSVPRLRRAFGEGFRAAGLIRDPLKRLNSQMALYRRFQFDSRVVRELRYSVVVRGYWGIRRIIGNDAERRAFAIAANKLNRIIRESQALDYIVRTEDLVRDPNCCRELVRWLSAGAIDAPASFYESAISETRPENCHSREAQGLGELADWHVDILRAVVHPRAWELHESHGYLVPEEFAKDARSRAAA
jgi:hypothetical protein